MHVAACDQQSAQYFLLQLIEISLCCGCIVTVQVKLSTETVTKRGLVMTKVKATEIVKEHQTYCDTEREIKHFPAETLAYVTPVSEWNEC